MKDKIKEKKSSKDKKRGHTADGSEKRPVKPKVDELKVMVLRQSHSRCIIIFISAETLFVLTIF